MNNEDMLVLIRKFKKSNEKSLAKIERISKRFDEKFRNLISNI